MIERALTFVGVAALLTAVPGPAIVLIMKNALTRGRRGAATTAVGVLMGDLVWVGTSLAGLGALLISSRPAFEVLRFAGATYLMYVGMRLLLRRRHDLDALVGEVPRVEWRAAARRRAFGEGALCELSNPKTLLVFTTVIPPFVPPGSATADLALFGLLFAVTGFLTCLV